MAGYLRKRGSSWQLIVSGGFDPKTGKRIQHTKTMKGSKREADAALAKLVVEADAGEVVDTRLTLGELIDAWLQRARGDLSPSTVRTTEYFISNYIGDSIGKVPLRKLTPAKLDKYYGNMRDSGGFNGKPLAARTVRRAHNIIHGSLEQGIKWGWLASNPAAKATPPKLGRLQIRAPEPEEVTRLLQAAQEEDPDYAMILRLAAASGARRGELCALRWSVIDVENCRILIKAGIVMAPGGDLVEKDTKTHQARQMAIDPATIELLKLHRQRQRERLATMGLPWHENLFVFSYDPACENPISPDRITHRFRRMCDRLDLEHVRFHDLRHYVATRLIASGVPVRTVSGRLGHADASTTLNVYSHFVEATDQDAAALLGALLEGKGSEETS